MKQMTPTPQRLAPALAAALTLMAPASFADLAVYGSSGLTGLIGDETDFLAEFTSTAVTEDFAELGGVAIADLPTFDATLGDDPTSSTGIAVLQPSATPYEFDNLDLLISGNNTTAGTNPSGLSNDFGPELVVDLFPGEIEGYTFQFDNAINAFGATFFSPASSDGFLLTAASADTIDTFDFFLTGNGQGGQFLGVVSDTPFTSLSFEINNGLTDPAGEGVFVSNAVFGTANFVPEPASLALLGLGGLFLTGRSRRRA